MPSSNINWNIELYNQKHAFVCGYGEKLLELLAPQAGESILDLGCGSGQLTAQIATMAKEAVGVDQSPEMIADARSKYPDLVFQVADAAGFIAEKPFDAIFSNATLHWVKDYQNAIRCMYANLQPSGRLVLEMGGKGNVATITEGLRQVLRARGYTQQAAFEQWFFPSLGEYAQALEAVGFRVLLARHYDRPTPLAEEQTGIMDWLNMFAKGFFKGVDPDTVQEIGREVQENVRSSLFCEGKWYADYKRLQVIAIKSTK